MAYELSKRAFGELVQRALGTLPSEFHRYLEDVRIEVRGRPTPRMLRCVNAKPGHTLLGLYEGRPRTLRHVDDAGYLPDVIYLFQREIEAICNSEQELIEQVRTTLLHEVGHHFGLDEAELDELGYS